MAVVQLLDAAQKRPADLARRSGYSPAAVSRYLSSRDRTPSQETILEINEAMAQVIGTIEIRDFLTSVAIIEGLISDDNRLSSHGTLGALNSIRRYFADESFVSVYESLADFPDDKRQRITRELSVVHFKSLIRHIVHGHPNSLFEQIFETFARYDFDLTPHLVDKETLQVQLINDEFAKSLRKILIRNIENAASRLDVESSILTAFYGSMIMRSQRSLAILRKVQTESRDLGQRELALKVLELMQNEAGKPGLGRKLEYILKLAETVES